MSARIELLGLALAMALVPAATWGAPERSGREVVEQQCVACHGAGREGSPRIGDAKAWAKLKGRGLPSLTESALAGVRKMPPHGGNPTITDLEVRRAIAYMVNQSGGNWAEPTDRRRLPAARSGEAIVKSRCAACHEAGLHGAPRIGDREAWIARAKMGFDGLVRSAINGHGAMPARGGVADLTDPEMRSAITYLFQESAKRK